VQTGGYEAPVTLAAVLMGVAISLRFTGMRLPIGLLVEGELLLAAGLSLHTTYLRGLASLPFPAARVSLAPVLGAPDAGGFTLLGRQWTSSAPGVVLFAVAFYTNSELVRRRSKALLEPLYAAAGTLAALVAIGRETPERFVGLAWLTFSVVLIEA